MKRQALKGLAIAWLASAVSLSAAAASAQSDYAHPVFGVGDTVIQSDVFVHDRQGRVAASEGTFTRQMSGWLGNDEVLKGEVVHVGRGCNVDAYLGSPTGKIALIERGACTFVEKLTRAHDNGAIGAIVYNSIAGVPGVTTPGEFLFTMIGSPGCTTFACPDLLPIPGFFVARSHELMLAAAPATVTIQAASFRVLKDSVTALAQDGTLSNSDAGAWKDLISEASDLASAGNFAAARDLIVQFRADVIAAFGAGMLPFSYANELQFTAAILAGRLQPPFTTSP